MKRIFIFIISFLITAGIEAQSVRKEFKSEGWSGNPVFEGWYADPEGIIYGDEFWIFPTMSDFFVEVPEPPELSPLQKRLQKNTINPQYLKQTYLDAFSSNDLINWTKHPRVLDIINISWAAYSLWAPSVIHANGKYYLFFGANDIQSDDELGGIGVAVSDSPTGPFARIGKILQQNPEVATGAGHHSVIHIPKTDIYYIVYHRRPLNTKNRNHREVCIDRMYFNKDGTIKPVEITFKDVKGRGSSFPSANLREFLTEPDPDLGLALS